MNRYTLLYIKQRNKKGLLYNTGHYIQRLVITYNRKEVFKKPFGTWVFLPFFTSLFGVPSMADSRQ